MCGIAGIIAPRANSIPLDVYRDAVDTMTASLAHRGPDDQGVWADPQGRCVLGQRRLSIIDTSPAGHQPFFATDQRRVIVFNGEIYNFLEVRAELVQAGVRLRGRTDTEVLLEAVTHWGLERALPRLDGMYAFVIFDTVTGEALLARDAFGEKPLYLTTLPDGVIGFASELHALERLPGFDTAGDADAMAELLCFQYIGAPRTIYASARKLMPGGWLRVEPGGIVTTGSHFAFRPGSDLDDRPIAEQADELEDILTRSIERRLIADVPLGAFLSGGVDSSTVCALVRRRLGVPLKTFSMGFTGAPESEHLTARRFAEILGTDHNEQLVASSQVDFLFESGHLLDEPNADSSCLPTWLLSRFAREQVTVAVSGDGGDEMFGGYNRYLATLEEAEAARRGERGAHWSAGADYYGPRILVSQETHIRALFGAVPERLGRQLRGLRETLDRAHAEGGLLAAMRRTDVENYMPGAVLAKVDRMSMRHGLEVRTPFLSREVARFAERLPDAALVGGNRGKLVLRELAYRHLPRELMDLPKQGFGLPMTDWGRGGLLDAARKLLRSEDSRLRAALGGKALDSFIEEQSRPGQFSPYQVWALASLESWLRSHPLQLPSFAPPLATGGAAKGMLPRVAVRATADVVVAADSQARAAAELKTEEFAALVRSLDADGLEKGTPGDAAESGDAIKLPVFDADRGAIDPVLDGATVILCDPEASDGLGFAEFEWLASLGARRVVFASPRESGAWDSVLLRRISPGQREAAFSSLYPRRAAGFGLKPRLRSLATFLAGRRHGHAMTSGRIDGLAGLRDDEAFRRFLVFEGDRQLPPVRTSHRMIMERGGGRYRFADGTCFMSSTRGRLAPAPFWIVERTPEIEPLVTAIPGESYGPFPMAKAAEAQPRQHMSLLPGDRIVVATHGLSPGGAERQWVYLAQELHAQGFDVTFLATVSVEGASSHYCPMLTQAGIPLREVVRGSAGHSDLAAVGTPISGGPSAGDLLPDSTGLADLVATLRQLAPRAVFTQLDGPNLYVGFAAMLAGVPSTVLSFRNYNPSHFPYLHQDWLQAAYQVLVASDRIGLSGNNPWANRDYADWIGIAHDDVAYIPNALDLETWRPPSPADMAAERAKLGISSQDRVILGLFRLSAEKDPLTFVAACARVAREIPTVKVLLAGQGPMEDEVRAAAAAAGLSKNLILLGRRSDVPALLAMADVFLFTSTREGMPNAVMEAQAMGCPIVATDITGTRGVVVDQETALLRPVGDVGGLAEACITLLRSPGLAAQFGDAGRRVARERHSKALMAQRYVHLAQSALEQPDAPPRDGASRFSPPYRLRLRIPSDEDLLNSASAITRRELEAYVRDLSAHPLRARFEEFKQISMLHVDVLLLLRLFARAARGPILEIGPYIGGSTLAIASGNRERGRGAFLSIEPGGTHPLHPSLPSDDIFGDLTRFVTEAGLADHVELLRGFSTDPAIISRVFEVCGDAKLDLVFMDADGRVDRDLDIFRPLLKPGTILVFDDYVPGEAEPAVAATAASFEDALPDWAASAKPGRVVSAVEKEVAAGRIEPLGIYGWGTWFGRYLGN